MPELHTTKPEPKRHDFAAGETGRGPSVPSNGLANDPKAGQWDGRRMSKRMIADYKTFIVTDGEGVRNSLYVSGCPFHCVDCFNASIWDFQAGHEYTQKLEDKIIEDLKAPWVQGITFLGGEPFLNTPVLVPLAQRIRQEFGHTKDIWSWTGYTWEELMRPEKPQTSLNCYISSTFSSTAATSETRRTRCCNSAAPETSASSMCPSLWKPANRSSGPSSDDQERDIPEIYLKDREAGEGQQAS